MNTTDTLKKLYPTPEDAKAGLRPVRLGLFPVMDNMEAVIDLGISQLPITNPNELIGLLMTYHNTMVQAMEEAPHEELTQPVDV